MSKVNEETFKRTLHDVVSEVVLPYVREQVQRETHARVKQEFLSFLCDEIAQQVSERINKEVTRQVTVRVEVSA